MQSRVFSQNCNFIKYCRPIRFQAKNSEKKRKTVNTTLTSTSSYLEKKEKDEEEKKVEVSVGSKKLHYTALSIEIAEYGKLYKKDRVWDIGMHFTGKMASEKSQISRTSLGREKGEGVLNIRENSMKKDTKVARKKECIWEYKPGKTEQCQNGLEFQPRVFEFYPTGHRLCDHTSQFARNCCN